MQQNELNRKASSKIEPETAYEIKIANNEQVVGHKYYPSEQ
jgi:hypothetical protein